MSRTAKLVPRLLLVLAGAGVIASREPLAPASAMPDDGAAERPLADRATRMRELAAEVDAALLAAQREAGLTPAPPVDDAGWLRRASLDLRGVIPTADEAAAFLHDPAADKRERTIDAYLADPQSARSFGHLFANMLLAGAGEDGERISRRWIAPWITDEWRDGTRVGAIVHQLIAATSHSANAGPAGLAIAYRDTIETLSGTLAHTFLGLQIQCAQCHDDPAGHWTQEQFNRFTGFFADLTTSTEQGEMVGDIIVAEAPAATRLFDALRRAETTARRALQQQAKAAPAEPPADGDTPSASIQLDDPPEQRRALQQLRMQLREPERGQAWRSSLLVEDEAEFEAWVVRHPAWSRDTLRAMRGRELPWGRAGHLDGTAYAQVEGEPRRRALADWVVAAENPWFGRAMANRAVAHLLGHGLVEPVDDLLGAADKVAPALLDRLAQAFTAEDADWTYLLGALARTQAYAAGPSTATTRPARLRDERSFAAHPVRPLAAEQLIASLNVARGGEAGGRSKERDRFISQLKRTFGELSGEGRGGHEPSIPQELHLMHSLDARLAQALRNGPMSAALADATKPAAERLRPFFLATLNRLPSDGEVAAIAPLLEFGSDPVGQRVDELWWALVNSAEFHSNR
ncbi:MAG: DUF1549 domain-containing protein [Planctomycetes bacterium]|nr:DUF1549 domain-containing protein [Planctomycetota bacterium]